MILTVWATTIDHPNGQISIPQMYFPTIMNYELQIMNYKINPRNIQTLSKAIC